MSKRLFLCALLVAALCVGYVSADDEEDTGAVRVLTAADFTDSVNDGKVWFIKFFAPWCGHCKRLAPTWKDLAADLNDNDDINIGHVDCTQHRDICTAADVKGYPTLMVYHNGEAKDAYRSARNLEDLKEYIKGQAAILRHEKATV